MTWEQRMAEKAARRLERERQEQLGELMLAEWRDVAHEWALTERDRMAGPPKGCLHCWVWSERTWQGPFVGYSRGWVHQVPTGIWPKGLEIQCVHGCHDEPYMLGPYAFAGRPDVPCG